MTREEELSALCRACGACCNGVMFAFVDVAAGELKEETRRHLRVVEAKGVFEQPCPAHGASGCGVYSDRPARCRDYTCEIYREHEASGGDLERKLYRVRRIQQLAEALNTRRGARDAEWLPRAVAEMLANVAQSDLEPELLLDVAELAMRLQRDLGWAPPQRREEPP